MSGDHGTLLLNCLSQSEYHHYRIFYLQTQIKRLEKEHDKYFITVPEQLKSCKTKDYIQLYEKQNT